jgi:hypothetical protein
MKKLLFVTLLFVAPLITLADEATSTATTTPETTVEETIVVNLNIRHTNTVIFSSPITVPKNKTIGTLDNTGASHTVLSDSVLGALVRADSDSELFRISDLAHYSSFDSFIINCIEANTSNFCYNWQYVVNNTYPYVGIDDYILSQGDTIYLYFGSPRKFSFTATTTDTQTPFDVLVETYDYENDAWNPLENARVGATQPNPSDPYSPLVPFSSMSNTLGIASLLVSTPGTFDIGLELDYYYPTQPIVVIEALSTTTSTSTPPENTQSNNSSSRREESQTTEPQKNFDLEKALSFILSYQNEQGVFANDLYTDWALLALIAGDASGNAISKTKKYITENPTTGSYLLDYERRALSLMSAGINPYTGSSKNYIDYILKTFDGTQFGNSDLFNDDIFALIPLVKAGYGTQDPEIQQATAFIISKQDSNGSWLGVDLTSASIQALVPVRSLSGVEEALQKAKNYLKNAQGTDGGFGNSFATSWAIQAIHALGEDPKTWTKNNRSPLDYLANIQDPDGGLDKSLDTNSRLWATSYAITAQSGKTWNALMATFSKNTSRDAGSSPAVSAGTTGTTTGFVLGTSTSALIQADRDITRKLVLDYIYELTGLTGDTLILLYEPQTVIPAPKKQTVSTTTEQEIPNDTLPARTFEVPTPPRNIKGTLKDFFDSIFK